MQARHRLFLAITTLGVAGIAAAQTTDRSATDTARDAANAVGRAASAAVTPGDQNMGRDPNNRSGGLMGNDRSGTPSAATRAGRAASAAVTPGDQDMGRNPNNRSGGMMGSDSSATSSTSGTNMPARSRAARNDRG